MEQGVAKVGCQGAATSLALGRARGRGWSLAGRVGRFPSQDGWGRRFGIRGVLRVGWELSARDVPEQGGYEGIAGRAAQQTRVRAVWCLL